MDSGAAQLLRLYLSELQPEFLDELLVRQLVLIRAALHRDGRRGGNRYCVANRIVLDKRFCLGMGELRPQRFHLLFVFVQVIPCKENADGGQDDGKERQERVLIVFHTPPPH